VVDTFLNFQITDEQGMNLDELEAWFAQD